MRIKMTRWRECSQMRLMTWSSRQCRSIVSFLKWFIHRKWIQSNVDLHHHRNYSIGRNVLVKCYYRRMFAVEIVVHILVQFYSLLWNFPKETISDFKFDFVFIFIIQSKEQSNRYLGHCTPMFDCQLNFQHRIHC